MTTHGPLLRIFEVRTKPSCAEQLSQNFATTSTDVVHGHPGNRGHFFGRCVQGNENTVMFVSVWDNLDAVKARFGEAWQTSYMPEGYEDLIEDCHVRHFDMSEGWQVKLIQS